METQQLANHQIVSLVLAHWRRHQTGKKGEINQTSHDTRTLENLCPELNWNNIDFSWTSGLQLLKNPP